MRLNVDGFLRRYENGRRNFAGIELSGSLAGCVLDDLVLVGADLRGVDFSRASLARADLTGANIEGGDFTDALLEEAVLDGCWASGARFAGAGMYAVRMRGATAVGVDMERARLTPPDYSSAADLTGTNLTSAKLVDATLNEVCFRGARLLDADLTGAKAMRTVFANADLRAAKLVNMRAQAAVFASADLTGASLAGSQMPDSVFSFAVMSNLDVDGATDLRDVHLDNTSMEKTLRDALEAKASAQGWPSPALPSPAA